MTGPTVAHPFVKWAGGKTALIRTLLDLFPKKIRTYYEPFVGAGAVFFALANEKERCRRFVLNDTNRELMDAYRVIRDFPADMMTWLRMQEEMYAAAPQTIYEALRNPDPFMQQLLTGPVERAGRFVFLNKAGYNGLYRVNQKGLFNVPWGKKKVVHSYDGPNIAACSKVLNGYVQLLSYDFEAAVADAREGDLVYFDPPYMPVNATSNFTSYTRIGFDYAAQVRLRDLFVKLADNRIAVVLSNSDTPEVRELYDGWELSEVQAKRSINSKPDRRGPVGELIIVGRRAARKLSLPPTIYTGEPIPPPPPSVDPGPPSVAPTT